MTATPLNLRRTSIALAALVGAQLVLASAAVAQVSEFDIQRATTQRAAVRMAAYQIAAAAGNLDGDPYQETPAWAAGAGPTGGGVIPDGYGFPRTDGYGAVLGYCAWDNGTSTGLAGHLPGGLGNQQPVFAVISYGLNNTFETTCATLATTGAAQGDDYSYWFSVGDTSYTSNSNILGSQYWRDAVDTAAALAALSPATLINGEVRLVRADGALWQYNGTAWNPVKLGGVAGDGSGNTVAENKLVVGQTSVGAEQLFVNAGAAAALGLQSSGARTGTALYNGTGTQTGFVGYNNAQGHLLLESQTGPIVLQAGGAERFRVNTDGALSQNGTVVLDATRNLVNMVNGTFSGMVSAAQVNATSAIQLGGVTVVDAARNASVAGLTASGNASVGGTLAITGALSANGGLATTTVTASGAITGASGTFSGAVSTGALTAGGLLSANNGVATNTLSSSGQMAFTGNYTGSAASPALAFTGSNYTGGTGLYSPGSNALGLATNGVSRLTVSNTGQVTITGAATVGGKLTTAAASAASAGLTLPHGAAPTAPVNGDLWTTTGGVFTRVSGVTQRLIGAEGTVDSGKLAIADSTTGGFKLAHLAGTANQITVLNGNGAITLSLPQNIHTAATPTFAGATLTGGLNGTTGTFSGALTAASLNTTAGATIGGKLTTAAASAAGAGFTLPHGAAPTAPVNGDLWTTTGGVFTRVNGVTQRLIGAEGTVDSGKLAIGDSTTGGFKLAHLAGTANQITVLNGNGAITLSLPQDIHVGAAPTFAGATLTGKLNTSAATTTRAGLTIPHGAAPTTPADGDLWTTTVGVFTRINGVTRQVADLNSAQSLTNKTLGTGSVWNGNAVSVAYGGTGGTTVGGAGALAYSTGTAYAFSAAGAAGQVLLSGGTAAPTWVDTTGAGSVVRATSPTLTSPTLAGAVSMPGTMAAWNTSTPGLGVGSIHIGQASVTANSGAAITFAARDGGAGTQAGIYTVSDGTYGTKMMLATTDAYASGAKTAITVHSGGQVTLNRGALQLATVASNGAVCSLSGSIARGADGDVYLCK